MLTPKHFYFSHGLLHLDEVAEFIERVWTTVGGNRFGPLFSVIKLVSLLAFAGGALWLTKDLFFKVFKIVFSSVVQILISLD